MDVVLD